MVGDKIVLFARTSILALGYAHPVTYSIYTGGPVLVAKVTLEVKSIFYFHLK